MRPKVSIIILNWNGILDTLECLNSVYSQDYTNYEVIIVDNASTDNSVEKITAEYPNTIIIQNEKNHGYAEGNNIGLRHAMSRLADFMFILNNDTIIKSNTISLLIDDLVKNTNAIAVSPISYNYGQRDNIYFAGGKISSRGETSHIKHVDSSLPGYSTEWLNGCALMIRSDYLTNVGYFEPKFFLVYEDVDWSLRAKKMGYDLRIVTASEIYHKVSSSFGGPNSSDLRYYFTRNYHLLIDRNFPKEQRIIYHKNRILRDLKSIKNFIKILIGYSPFHKAIRQGYIDYFFNRFYQRNYEW